MRRRATLTIFYGALVIANDFLITAIKIIGKFKARLFARLNITFTDFIKNWPVSDL